MDYQFEKEPNDQNDQFYRPSPNGMESAALILGILALCTGCCFYFSIPMAGLSILFALLSKGYEQKMDSRAKTGLILSVIAIAASLILILTTATSSEFQQTFQEYYDLYSSF